MSSQDKSIHDKKNKSISEAIRAIHKQFGSGSIMRLDGSEVQPVEVIPTGSVALDVRAPSISSRIYAITERSGISGRPQPSAAARPAGKSSR